MISLRHRLPSNILNQRGAVLRLSVWDEDLVNDDFIGEHFIALQNLTSLQHLMSLRDVPVTEIRLRRPLITSQPHAFEVKLLTYNLNIFHKI
jgi:hypothetical protein